MGEIKLNNLSIIAKYTYFFFLKAVKPSGWEQVPFTPQSSTARKRMLGDGSGSARELSAWA